jgi:hypothetical protein
MVDFQAKWISSAALAALSLAIVLTGCRPSSDFNEDVAKGAIESQPMTLEGEQVTLTGDQIHCGVQNELWESPTSLSPDHSTAHLTSKARDLKFNDDVIVSDPGATRPYVQVRGSFPIQVDSVTGIKPGEDGTTKLAEAKASVRIDNACFPQPLPLMGVKHGNFNVDAPVVFHFHFDDATGWHADKIVH